MQFKRPLRRRPTESVVPMINVVFLLLIFFMMSARIAPAPPFDLTLPAAARDTPVEQDITLYLSADGQAGFQGQLDDDAWTALLALDRAERLSIRADATLPAPRLASVMSRLAGLGFSSISLVLRAP